ncbi:MAG TPA: hypothetical protein VIK78_14575 [Ruminiclostridium sp.]
MANNRMYLVCRGCNKGFMIGKTMLDGYYTSQEDFEHKLNEFYSLHDYCNITKEVNSENQFELAYETAVDEDVKELIF